MSCSKTVPSMIACLAAQLPLDGEHANTRKAAIVVLQAMLAQPELATRRDGSPAVTPEFVRTALARLTGHETVQLLDWADVGPSAPQLSWYLLSSCECSTLSYHLHSANIEAVGGISMRHMSVRKSPELACC